MKGFIIATLAILAGMLAGAQIAHVEDHARTAPCADKARDAIAVAAEDQDSSDIAYYDAMKVLTVNCGARFVVASDGTQWAP